MWSGDFGLQKWRWRSYGVRHRPIYRTFSRTAWCLDGFLTIPPQLLWSASLPQMVYWPPSRPGSCTCQVHPRILGCSCQRGYHSRLSCPPFTTSHSDRSTSKKKHQHHYPSSLSPASLACALCFCNCISPVRTSLRSRYSLWQIACGRPVWRELANLQLAIEHFAILHFFFRLLRAFLISPLFGPEHDWGEINEEVRFACPRDVLAYGYGISLRSLHCLAFVQIDWHYITPRSCGNWSFLERSIFNPCLSFRTCERFLEIDFYIQCSFLSLNFQPHLQ